VILHYGINTHDSLHPEVYRSVTILANKIKGFSIHTAATNDEISI
jgi:hypothetical protein